MHRVARLLITGVVAGAAIAATLPAVSAAAGVELGAFGGYYIAADIYNSYSVSSSSKVELANSVMYGGRLTLNPSNRGGIEFAWTRTGSDVTLHTAQVGQPRSDIGRVDFDNYDINFIGYQPSGNARVTPFGLIGFGWAMSHPKIDSDFIDPTKTQPDGNTLFNFNFGLGAVVDMGDRLAMRLEGRWRVMDTNLVTSSGIWCDPWGYCYSYASDWYNSGELTAGLTFKLQGR